MSFSFEQFFGAELRAHDGQLKPTSSLLASAEVVGIYFSAHWCGPCRGFTPQLAKAYKQIKQNGKAFEIVFVSSDRDEKSFEEYADEMPWQALPFSDRERKGQLSKKYKVQGIPTLVLVDRDGKTLSTDGRSIISEDTEGLEFPWKPASFAASLGHTFITPDQKEVTSDHLKDKVVGIYFSAHWCPPCKAFTPVLAESYKTIQQRYPNKFEIVFVSSDRDQAAFDEYHHEMPWIAVPYVDRDRKNKLSKLFDVSGIPTFVIVDYNTGAVINANGRGAVSADKLGDKFPWHPPAVADLNSPDGINETTAIVVFAGCVGKTEQDAIEKEMETVAKKLNEEAKAKGEDAPFLFFLSREAASETEYAGYCDVTNTLLKMGQNWYHQSNSTSDLVDSEYEKLDEGERAKYVKVINAADLGEQRQAYAKPASVSSRVAQMTKMDTSSQVKTAILDIPSEGAFYVDGDGSGEVTVTSLTTLIEKFRSGGIPRQQL